MKVLIITGTLYNLIIPKTSMNIIFTKLINIVAITQEQLVVE